MSECNIEAHGDQRLMGVARKGLGLHSLVNEENLIYRHKYHRRLSL